MSHYCFKQPNGKYSVWSSIVDAPIILNASKKDIWRWEDVRNEFEWKNWCKDSIEEAIGKGDIECCLYNGNMTKDELLDYFKDIGYSGCLYEYAKNLDLEELDEDE